MSIKFKFFFFFLLVFSRGFSQADSTDISFTAVPFEQQSLEDSLLYGSGELSTLKLEFDIDEPGSFGKVWVEVIRIDEEGHVAPAFYDSYTLAELTSAGYLNGNNAEIELFVLQLTADYRVMMRIEDSYGHEKIFITKYLD